MDKNIKEIRDWNTNKLTCGDRLIQQEIYDLRIIKSLYYHRNSRVVVEAVTQKTRERSVGVSEAQIQRDVKSYRTRMNKFLAGLLAESQSHEKYEGSEHYRIFETSYKQAPGYGRMNAVESKTQFLMSRPIRATLCRDIYHDLDMVNAHPVILLQYINKYPETLTKNLTLKNYVEKRSQFFETVKTESNLTPEQTKTQVLRIINNGGSDEEFNHCESSLLRAFYFDMKKTTDEFQKLAKTQTFKELGFERSVRKEKNNREGTILNRFLMYAENLILQALHSEIIKRGVTPGPLSYDGLMILKPFDKDHGVFLEEFQISEKDIKDIEAVILEKTGYPVTLKYKEMPKALTLPKTSEKITLLPPTDQEYVKTYKDIMANVELEDKIILEGKTAVFYHKAAARWMLTTSKLTVGMMISDKLQEYYQVSLDDTEAIGVYIKDLQGKRKMETLGSLFFEDPNTQVINEEDRIIKKLNMVSPEEIPISKNRVIHLRTCKIRPRTAEDYFTYEVPREFVNLEDEERDRIRKNFYGYFRNPETNELDEETAQSFLNAIGYSMSGESLKKFFTLVGESNTGKSTFFNLLDSTIATTSFITSVNPILVCDDINSGGIKAHHEAISKGQRVAYCSEFSENMKMNKETIKRLTGNDSIQYRAMYVGDIEYRSVAKIWLFTNELPRFDAYDNAFIERLHVFEFTEKFDNPTEEQRETLTWLESNKNKVFTFLCECARDFYKTKKLPESTASRKCKEQIIKEMDPLLEFIESKLIVDDNIIIGEGGIKPRDAYEQGYLSAKGLWEIYLSYTEITQQKRVTKKKFDYAMARHLKRTKADFVINKARITVIYHCKNKE